MSESLLQEHLGVACKEKNVAQWHSFQEWPLSTAQKRHKTLQYHEVFKFTGGRKEHPRWVAEL